ncbi:MAG TPA: DNA repair protein RecO [Candidatus Magasanikbacteria bacterium]|nr:DNA repair protein RecO [Candidatus Magasanikbacteria bacterium]
MLSFVLKRRDLKEFDQVVALFSAEKGKIEVLAKGVKKVIAKNSAYLEPFFLIEAEIVEGKEVWHLTKAVPVESFKNIRANLEKSLIAGYICEVLNVILPERAAEKKIFDLVFGFLNYLENTKEANRVLIISFLWKSLCLLGFLPTLKNCVICGEDKETKYFSAFHGGCVCEDCKSKTIETNNMLFFNTQEKQSLKLLITGLWPQIKMSEEDLEKQEKLLFIFCAYHSEKKIPLPSPLLK